MNICKSLYYMLSRYRGINENTITYEEVQNIINNNEDVLLIDVRSIQEYREGHLPGSINISLYDIERGNYNIKNKNSIIIVYCQYGKRSKKAMQLLKKDGFTKVYSIEGGLENI